MAKLVAEYTYTDAELLALYREALAKLSLRQETTILGERLVFADLAKVQAQIEWLENRVNAASGLAVNYAKIVMPR